MGTGRIQLTASRGRLRFYNLPRTTDRKKISRREPDWNTVLFPAGLPRECAFKPADT
jgi:hypothetical protein